MKRRKPELFTAVLLAALLCFSVSHGRADVSAEKLELFRTQGSIVTFGRYEQDNDTDNGPEAIEWIVLEYNENEHKTMLISRYGLDTIPFSTGFNYVNWENCTLRTWLAEEFLVSAFDPEEQAAILMTAVDNSLEQGYDYYNKWKQGGGWTILNVNDTQDQIFLLSYAEANRYFDVTYEDKNNIKSRVAPTAYALARGAYVRPRCKTADDEAAGLWWLRSPGGNPLYETLVNTDGSLRNSHVRAACGGILVRPAFWLNLDSDIF